MCVMCRQSSQLVTGYESIRESEIYIADFIAKHPAVFELSSFEQFVKDPQTTLAYLSGLGQGLGKKQVVLNSTKFK